MKKLKINSFFAFLLFCLAISWLKSSTVIAQPKPELFVFFDVECPICQNYTNKLQKLYNEFGKEVNFKLIYPTKGTTTKMVRAFEKEYGFKIPYLIDEAHQAVKKYNASTTPEVFLVKNGEIIYNGMIDNQFIGLGKFRPKTSEYYLKDALEALKNDQIVSVKKTEPVGCLINHHF